MTKKIFAICDPEETYAYKMTEYFMEKVRLPYDMQLFTRIEALRLFAAEKNIEILLIAECAYKALQNEFIRQHAAQIFVLQETVEVLEKEEKQPGEDKSICYINKYQSPEIVVQIVLESIEGLAEWACPVPDGQKAKLIGIYSPVRRCLQTSFALAMGQILAKEHKTLYLNFESYSGLRQMLGGDFKTDIMDAMYYFCFARDKLPVKLPSIVQNTGGVDYIPPVQAGLDMREITGMQWVEFCQELAAVGEYEYIVLDLDDSMNGLFDLLQKCMRIYTVVKNDKFAAAKLAQYERTLRFYDLEDIAEKTVKCTFPVFAKLPAEPGQMAHGELAGYVREIIREDLYARK